jgi:hypothetical protein
LRHGCFREATGIIVNTGSKQGITTPPGNLAYNVSKVLKAYTEGLALASQHIGPRITAHLLIGFTSPASPPARWRSRPRMGARRGCGIHDGKLARGDFYPCPDNGPPVTDERRMASVGDIIETARRFQLASGLRDACSVYEGVVPAGC